MHRPALVGTLAAMALMVTVVGARAQTPQYRARLSVVPIDATMMATVAGQGASTASLKGATLTISGTFSGLRSAVTAVRLHRSAKPGMRGTAIAELTASGNTAGTIAGSIELTKEQIADLIAGRLYIQLHSQKAPDGNLWGWLLADKREPQ